MFRKTIKELIIYTMMAAGLSGFAVMAQDTTPGAALKPGIHFSKGSWQEIQELAKKEKKAIFIDVYTEWCGPCKKMAAEVFPQQKVGDVFNASFINYKIDAEKGEGIELSNKYNAKAYPTYLFINSEGELIYRTTGYMPAENFLKEAGIAITEKNDPRPLAKWMDEYKNGKRDKEFLLGYLKKRQATELPSAELLDELFPMLNTADLQQKETWTKLLASYISVQLVPEGPLYNYVVKHHAAIDSIRGTRSSSLYVMQFGLNNYILKNIVANKKEQELERAERCMKQVAGLLKSPDKESIFRKVKLDYYSKNYDQKKFNAAVTDYVENGLFKRDPNQMITDNKVDFDKFMEPYLSGKSDSTQVANWQMMKEIMRLGNAVNWSYALRDAAETIYMNSTDKAILQRGQAWAKRARDIFSHFSTEAVYAGLLFKNGNHSEAVKVYETELAKVPSVKTELFAGNMAKLKAGTMPQSLWK
jgi:thioredoxin-related protein